MRIHLLVPLLAVGLITACGGGDDGKQGAPKPAPSVADPVAAKAEITSTWEAFFKGGSPAEARIVLLEDGEKFRAVVTGMAMSPEAADLGSKVTDVGLNGSKAAVTYNLLGKGGAVLVPGLTGEAVLAEGKWRVTQKSFCNLLRMNPGVPAPAVCS